MSTTPKTSPTSKPYILEVAVALAKEHGLRKFSRSQVAKKTGLASATVSFHFGSMDALRTEVVKYAVENEVLSILADVRTDRDRADFSARMSAELKKKVANYIAA